MLGIGSSADMENILLRFLYGMHVFIDVPQVTLAGVRPKKPWT